MFQRALNLAIFFAVLATVLAFPALAVAAKNPPGMPPKGKVLLGVGGHSVTPASFAKMVGGKKHHIHLVTAPWREGYGWERTIESYLPKGNDDFRLMLHIGPMDAQGKMHRTPADVANGKADAYLLELSEVINARGEYIYVRPPAEMNGHWSVWSAYNKNGTKRKAPFSTANYRKAFIRMAEIVRGGDVSAINKRLRAQKMPNLQTNQQMLTRSGKISLVWNPQAEGSPNVRGNQPADYYPGSRWVDYFATDIYAQSGRAAWNQNYAFYKKYAKKHPFMIAEFAPWGYDDPSFVNKIFAWVNKAPRTVAVMYFQGTGTSPFQIHEKPNSLAAYKKQIRKAKFTCNGFSPLSNRC